MQQLCKYYKAGPWSFPQALGPQAHSEAYFPQPSEEGCVLLPKTNRNDVGCIIFPPLFWGRLPVLIKKDHHGLHDENSAVISIF